MSNSNNIGISAEQAVQVLLAAGFLIDFDYAGQGIALHNDADMTFIVGERYITLSQFYGEFEVLSKYQLAQCSIQLGCLHPGPAVSKQILE